MNETTSPRKVCILNKPLVEKTQSCKSITIVNDNLSPERKNITVEKLKRKVQHSAKSNFIVNKVNFEDVIEFKFSTVSMIEIEMPIHSTLNKIDKTFIEINNGCLKKKDLKLLLENEIPSATLISDKSSVKDITDNKRKKGFMNSEDSLINYDLNSSSLIDDFKYNPSRHIEIPMEIKKLKKEADMIMHMNNIQRITDVFNQLKNNVSSITSNIIQSYNRPTNINFDEKEGKYNEKLKKDKPDKISANTVQNTKKPIIKDFKNKQLHLKLSNNIEIKEKYSIDYNIQENIISPKVEIRNRYNNNLSQKSESVEIKSLYNDRNIISSQENILFYPPVDIVTNEIMIDREILYSNENFEEPNGAMNRLLFNNEGFASSLVLINGNNDNQIDNDNIYNDNIPILEDIDEKSNEDSVYTPLISESNTIRQENCRIVIKQDTEIKTMKIVKDDNRKYKAKSTVFNSNIASLTPKTTLGSIKKMKRKITSIGSFSEITNYTNKSKDSFHFKDNLSSIYELITPRSEDKSVKNVKSKNKTNIMSFVEDDLHALEIKNVSTLNFNILLN